MENSIKHNFNSYLGMTKRNVLLYFKDKTTIFFSMLAPLIVLFLYIIFLRDTYLSELKSSLSEFDGYFQISDVDNVVNAWLLAGILGTACITVSLNSLHVMVSDKVSKVDYDYQSSPVKGYVVILSYFTAAFLNTFIITSGILTIGLIVLNLIGSLYLDFITILLLYLVTVLGSASATIIMMIIVSFFKKASALAAFSGIVSAAIGFIIGAYIPLGNFSDTVQGVLSLFPGSHIACLYRNLLMSGVINNINTSLNGIDGGMFNTFVNQGFALNLNMFTYTAEKGFMTIYSLASIALAFGINVIFYKKSFKRA